MQATLFTSWWRDAKISFWTTRHDRTVLGLRSQKKNKNMTNHKKKTGQTVQGPHVSRRRKHLSVCPSACLLPCLPASRLAAGETAIAELLHCCHNVSLGFSLFFFAAQRRNDRFHAVYCFCRFTRKRLVPLGYY